MKLFHTDKHVRWRTEWLRIIAKLFWLLLSNIFNIDFEIEFDSILYWRSKNRTCVCVWTEATCLMRKKEEKEKKTFHLKYQIACFFPCKIKGEKKILTKKLKWKIKSSKKCTHVICFGCPKAFLTVHFCPPFL